MDRVSIIRIRNSDELSDEEIDWIIMQALKKGHPKRVRKIMTYSERILGIWIENPNRYARRITIRLGVLAHKKIVDKKKDGSGYFLLC